MGSIDSFLLKNQQLPNLKHAIAHLPTHFSSPHISSKTMPIPDFRRDVLERNRTLREREKPGSPLSRHLQKVYPVGVHKRNSSSSSFSSLSLSQNSNDSSIGNSIYLWDGKITDPFYGPFEKRETTAPYMSFHGHEPFERRGAPSAKVSFSTGHGHFKRRDPPAADDGKKSLESKEGNFKRCNWITKGSDQVYVQFHDERWGVPEYDDNQLFELLTLSGMLMDRNWTEILMKKDLYREAFADFDPSVVAKMEERDIIEISSNKKLMLAESRVRCIIDNAKCIVKMMDEYGSFSSYLWACVNCRPMINRYIYPRSVPLRTPKSEAISKDLVRRGFRFVGPVIIYSFMQAAGMTIDHLMGCFRFHECVGLAQRNWGHC